MKNSKKQPKPNNRQKKFLYLGMYDPLGYDFEPPSTKFGPFENSKASKLYLSELVRRFLDRADEEDIELSLGIFETTEQDDIEDLDLIPLDCEFSVDQETY